MTPGKHAGKSLPGTSARDVATAIEIAALFLRAAVLHTGDMP